LRFKRRLGFYERNFRKYFRARSYPAERENFSPRAAKNANDLLDKNLKTEVRNQIHPISVFRNLSTATWVPFPRGASRRSPGMTRGTAPLSFPAE